MPPTNATVWTVSQFTEQVKTVLDECFANVWVVGELTDYKKHVSGHHYFSLKDANSVLSCAFFRGSNLRLKFDPKTGMEVFARGRFSFYPQQGKAQLYVEEMQPKGEGAADLALKQLKEKLHAKGYFDPARKRTLPRFPRRIALVTSPTGAAVRDMLQILANRWPAAEVVIYPVRVQGESAPAEIAAAVRALSKLHEAKRLVLDAIVVGRGGGSAEDLSAFNAETVADAVFLAAVPVISAVGHETDVSIADLVADYRALTPSQAITALCPDRFEVERDLADRTSRLRFALTNRLVMSRDRLDRIADRAAFRRPLDRVHEHAQALDAIAERLEKVARRRIERSTQQLAAIAARLESLSPLKVLSRGYSLTRTLDGTVLRNAAAVQPGDRVVTRLATGEITSTVNETL